MFGLRPEISFLQGAWGAYAPSDEVLGVCPPQDEDEEAGSPIYVYDIYYRTYDEK